MNQYLALFLLVIFMYIGSLTLASYQVEGETGHRCYRVRPLNAFLFVIPLILFATFRDLYFGDTISYYRGYYSLPLNFSEFIVYLQQNPKDPGFTILCWIVKILGLDHFGLFFIIAAFQGLVLFLVYRKYSSNYFLSILLFYLSSDYYSWMYNGIRQFLAVTIAFTTIFLVKEKRYLFSIIILLIASSFHQSVLILLPFIFLSNGKALNRKVLIVGIVTVLILVFLSSFTTILDGFLQNTQYKNVVSDIQTGVFGDDDGTNPFRVLLYSIPFILSIVGLKIIRYIDDPIVNYCTNMSALTCFTYLISMMTSGLLIGRLPIYFSLYNYILLPWEIRNLFKKQQRIYVQGFVILIYVVFSLIQMKYVWSLF